MVIKSVFIGISCLIGTSLFKIGAYAYDLETTLQQALNNSYVIGSTRQSWIAARENVATKNATKELSADVSLTGKHSQTETSKSSSFSAWRKTAYN